ncbi:MAG: glycosyltransferase family 4 protein [Planctomycetota bacterium]|jgi:glycosyltransferase involved in cell wall biosynthesis
MRVLLINHFPLSGSGSGVYVANVARELKEMGHEVVVLKPDTAEPPEDEHAFELDTIVCPAPADAPGEDKDLSFPFPCFTTHPRSNRTFYALSSREMAEYLAVFEARIRAAVARLEADVIHAQHLWVCAAAASRTGKPYVVTCHGTDLLGYRAANQYRPFAHEAADRAFKVIAVSDSTAREVAEIFGVGDDRLLALPSGVDGRTFRPLEADRAEVFKDLGLPAPIGAVVAYAGKLACFKGPDVLIEAAAIYERQLPGVTTVIAGDGAERRGLESMARALRLNGMRFTGWLEQTQLARLYSAADVAAVPSREEPFGLAAIEAMACGAPVVASNVGGLPEHVDDSVGRLVNPDSPGELAHAITEEIKGGGRKVKGTAAAERAARHTWRGHTEKLVEIYEAAVAASG